MSPPPTPIWANGEKANNLWPTMARLYKYIGKYRFHIYIGILFSLLSSLATLIAPQYLNDAVNMISVAVGSDDPMNLDGIYRIVLILVAIYTCAALFRVVSGYIIPSASEYNGNVMRKDLSKKISRIPLSIIDRMKVGDIMSRFTNDTDNIRNQSAECIAHSITALVMVFGSLAMMVYMQWMLAIVSIIPALAGFVIMFIIIRLSQKRFKEQARNLGEINTMVEETYYGLEVVNSYNGRNGVRKRFERSNHTLFRNSMITRFISGSMPLITGFISNASYVIVCIVGAMMVLEGTIGYGVIVAFIVYVKEFSEPLGRLSNSIASMQTVSASSERIFEFLDLEEMKETSEKRNDAERISGRVVFNDVCFSYQPGREIIHHLDLTVEPGQKIAIVGPTGSGKTTIANLLMRFYDVDSGNITLDGTDIRDMTREDVHEAFCMILQDSWLFDGTIRDNITFGKDVPDDVILEACELVGIDDYINSLPNGIDTLLHEGNTLSAGQRQQINMVRALVRNTPLLILDEATSAMDTFTEKKVQAAMDKMMASHTSFVIAHRLATIEDADAIIVIKDGSIVEKGTHNELMKASGFYRELYDSQFENCD